jgi:pyridoxamine 5'-phosphate oxidase
MSYTGTRIDYTKGALEAGDLDASPLVELRKWFAVAEQAGVHEPNAMALTTVNAAGDPSSRIILIREVNDSALHFFTNYESRKGREIALTEKFCGLFFWPSLERQVRVEGVAACVPASVSDAYFASRPRGSQLGAWASRQSEELTSRDELEAALVSVTEQFAGKAVPRPPFWGGYALTPQRFEFWQGRKSRLHDRLVYIQNEGKAGYRMARLSP